MGVVNGQTPVARNQAWIDVGGTFTDCYVISQQEADSPNFNRRLRHKTLSSGLVPISIQSITPARTVLESPELCSDPDHFWVGAELRGYDAQRCIVVAPKVIAFDSQTGRLTLAEPMPQHVESFELDAGLEAPVLAVRRSLGCVLGHSLPPLDVRLGTTRGTNALLTRRGAKVAMAITHSLTDLLLIGDQTRPHLFQLSIERDQSLTAITVPVIERLNASGDVLESLDQTPLRTALQQARQQGCDSLAICLLHSYRNPVHELQVESIARELGFVHISRSSALAPLIEIVARARTTEVDAYLSPIVRSYLKQLFHQFGGEPTINLQVMTSAGGLVDWQEMAGKDSILSGPAGGVVALRALAEASGFSRLIGLDMGGTSTDTARTAPDQRLQYESTKAGVRILTPTLPIETVASGGGSICWFDGVSLRVGPQSAGAMPGPACYGRGGPLTITDLNVYLGRLPVDQFPFPIDLQAIAGRLQELNAQLHTAQLAFDSLEMLADGLRTIAAQQMAEAVRTVSIAQGADPREHVLVGFGGAAGQHICEIAQLLGISRVLHTREAGLLSALGMGLADERRDWTLPLYLPLTDIDLGQLFGQAGERFDQLTLDWSQRPIGHGEPPTIQRLLTLELRYFGTDVSLAVSVSDKSDLAQLAIEFHRLHRRRFGYDRAARPIEAVALRLEVLRSAGAQWPTIDWPADKVTILLDLDLSAHHLVINGQRLPAAHIPHADLAPATRIAGPAVVLSPGSTLVIPPGWQATSASDGTLLLEHVDRHANAALSAPARDDLSDVLSDPVAEAVYAQRLAAIATQMGLVLQQTALSVNVKQRRDFSCAVFDSAGNMLASAPHVPVHLGAMGSTVRAALAQYPNWQSGDVVVTNNPYAGGSHLPDITVISAIFTDQSSKPAMFVANRAHHADIGGLAPGSMSVTATRLGDEGAIIPMLRMTAEQCAELQPLRELLSTAQWPPRNIEENLADLRAQLAANQRAEQLLSSVATELGWQRMHELGRAVLSVAQRRVMNFIATLPSRPRAFTDYLDDGSAISVTIEHVGNRLRIDFAGTSPTSRTNFNANPSIVTAAVIYVLRCLIDDELPLNEGLLEAIDLHVPEGLLNPRAGQPLAESPAVAAGNVETSQRVVDCLLGAFEVAAASQGTMNNLLFGNARFGFYETICGGAGATSLADGASGVHTHMTNTRLTDPEVLETKFPARLLEFGLRRGSGGAGARRGGDGVVRVIQFLEPVTVSLLTSRRGQWLPYGLNGGGPGAAGKNVRIRTTGQREELPSACLIHLAAGEAIELQTPGGGGFGTP